MEDSIFKRVRIVDDEKKEIFGINMGYQSSYDNDEDEASVCIKQNNGIGICLMESEIKEIEII